LHRNGDTPCFAASHRSESVTGPVGDENTKV
jgi:hypothetical protein